MIQKSVTYAYGLSVAPLLGAQAGQLCSVWLVGCIGFKAFIRVQHVDVFDADDGLYRTLLVIYYTMNEVVHGLYGQCRMYIDVWSAYRTEGVTRCKLRAAAIFTQKSK